MNIFRLAPNSILIFLLAACGGGGSGGGDGDFTVGGSLSGLGAGKSVVLQNNGVDNLILSSNASFTFATSLSDGAAYEVTVLTPPDGYSCTVSNGSGNVDGLNITDVSVSCVGQPGDYFTISGEANGVLNILRHNEMTGYLTAEGFYRLPTTDVITDMAFDAVNQRLFAIDSTTLYALGWDNATGFSLLDQRDTSGNSLRLEMNADGTAVYVINNAAGADTDYVDYFSVSSAGVLSAGAADANRRALSVNPNDVVLSPDGDHLYVVSRDDQNMDVFTVNSNNSLSASPASQAVNWQSVIVMVFNLDGNTAYLSRSETSDSLVVYDVNGTDGSLIERASYSDVPRIYDMLVDKNGGNLYGYSNSGVVHYMLSTSGDPTFVAAADPNGFAGNPNTVFPNKIALSYTGAELYLGALGDVMFTFAVDAANGNLTIKGASRLSASQSLTAIGGDFGTLSPTATHLYAPDRSGIQKFEVATDGLLTTQSPVASSGSLIDGQAIVDYRHGLVLAAGQDASNTDTLTSYTLNQNGGLSQLNSLTSQADTGANNSTVFSRTEIDGSGAYMYVLDRVMGFLYVYNYNSATGIAAGETQAVDLSSNAGVFVENMAVHPTGESLYVVDFGNGELIGYAVGSASNLVPTGSTLISATGSGPRDIVYHPTGNYAYISLHNDAAIVGYQVGQTFLLGNKTTTALGAGIQPSPMAMHPSGNFLYAGEGGSNTGIEVFDIDSGSYAITAQSRKPVSMSPSWLEVDPQGRFLIARYEDDASIEVFSINADGSLGNSVQSGVVAGSDAGSLPSLTLVSPLR